MSSSPSVLPSAPVATGAHPPPDDGRGPADAGPAWHTLDADEVARHLGVDPHVGLDPSEAARRLDQYGPNQLSEPEPTPTWRRFLDQFRSSIVLLLVGAAALAALVGDLKDPIVIGLVLVANAVLGVVQEGRAARAMDALREMLVTRVRVRRGGDLLEVDTADLVPGDVVLLESGDRVPADGRLLLAVHVTADEASLTGESHPVAKQTEPLRSADLPLAERTNLLSMNTTLTTGRAEMVVTETGMATQIGAVAALLQQADPGPTPLQRQLHHLGTRLAVVALIAVSAVFALRLLQGDPLGDAALAAVSLAVAAIPEGLPAVVTVTLAIGVHRMAEHQAIVKRLHSVETLGSTSVVCSDKTGTLTRNEMTARELVVAGTLRSLDSLRSGGARNAPDAADVPDDNGVDDNSVDDNGVEDRGVVGPAFLRAAVLCSDAVPGEGLERGVGDPTELALIQAAAAVGIDAAAERTQFPRLGEVPFDPASKFMATLHADDEGMFLAVKGAPDVLLARATTQRDDDGLLTLDAARRAAMEEANQTLAAQGRRVLALATRRLTEAEATAATDGARELADFVDDLTIDALVGIVDPPRDEARDAIAQCHRSGVGVKMITGDHAATATAIAAELGIQGRTVTGADLNTLSDEQLADQIGDIGVCARVAPEHKVRIVEALRSRGEVVAMTGDGVNDAAALRTADIGVAMGITGTEVTKEAADLVLADDNFATIVGAVERGRVIYDNIVKFVRFQLSTSLSAIGSLIGSSLLGLPVPFTPIQVLFVNLIADGPPAMTLGVDPPSPGTLDRPPRPTDEPILGRRRLAGVVFLAAVIAVTTIAMLAWSRDRYGEAVALTMTFTTFVLAQLVNALNVRSEHRSLLGRFSLTNAKLWAALGAVTVVQLLVVSWGPLQSVFDTVPLTATQWAICAAAALTVLAAEETRKLVVRSTSRRRAQPTGADGPAQLAGARIG